MRSILTLSLLVALPALADAPAAISVDIAGFRSDRGWAMCALFAQAEGYPGDVSKALRTTRSPIHAGAAICQFPGVVPGTYAVAVFHDENDNGVLDKNWLGIPKEGLGASNNAKGFMGPPKFDAAKFNYSGGLLSTAIKAVYL